MLFTIRRGQQNNMYKKKKEEEKEIKENDRLKCCVWICIYIPISCRYIKIYRYLQKNEEINEK